LVLILVLIDIQFIILIINYKPGKKSP